MDFISHHCCHAIITAFMPSARPTRCDTCDHLQSSIVPCDQSEAHIIIRQLISLDTIVNVSVNSITNSCRFPVLIYKNLEREFKGPNQGRNNDTLPGLFFSLSNSHELGNNIKIQVHFIEPYDEISTYCTTLSLSLPR